MATSLQKGAQLRPTPRRSALSYLYNHNPFYVISAVLMLYAVRSAYGTLEIGMINTRIMMGVLAGYTLLLAVIGVLIVRWGQVWEDARSIILLLLLLFLGVSISTDDLFSRVTADEAKLLLLCGFLFSAIVSEVVLWATRIRLGLLYRIPYHLLLALFYVAPWWCSPELHPRSSASLEWILLGFPAVAALLFLCLLPAVHCGKKYVENNGTPWGWPLFPGIAFGVIAMAVSLRSFALCMTFGPAGPMWQYSSGVRSISFDTLWGPYFLIPFGLAIILLLFEAGLVTKNRSFQMKMLCGAPLLLLLSLPISDGAVFQGFLRKVTLTIGSPIWLTILLLITFYTWAWVRRVPHAVWGIIAAASLLTVVGSETISQRTMIDPNPLLISLLGLLLIWQGFWKRSSLLSATGVVAVICGLWIWLPTTSFTIAEQPIIEYRFHICFHMLWFSCLMLGLIFQDTFSKGLRFVTACLLPMIGLFALFSTRAGEIALDWRLIYVTSLAVIWLMIAKIWAEKSYLISGGSTLAIIAYTGMIFLYRSLVTAFGHATVTAFAWSVGALLIGFLISAHKANWIDTNGWFSHLLPTSKKDEVVIEIVGPPPPDDVENLNG